jgi:hypothetical protein
VWTCDKMVELPIKMKKNGVGSETPITFHQQMAKMVR